jgi:hypothetical protein
MLFSSLEVVVCCAARQLGLRAALQSVYLSDVLRLLRRRGQRGSDIDVNVVAGICHVGIHCGGGVSNSRAVNSKYAGCCGGKLARLGCSFATRDTNAITW